MNRLDRARADAALRQPGNAVERRGDVEAVVVGKGDSPEVAIDGKDLLALVDKLEVLQMQTFARRYVSDVSAGGEARAEVGVAGDEARGGRKAPIGRQPRPAGNSVRLAEYSSAPSALVAVSV